MKIDVFKRTTRRDGEDRNRDDRACRYEQRVDASLDIFLGTQVVKANVDPEVVRPRESELTPEVVGKANQKCGWGKNSLH